MLKWYVDIYDIPYFIYAGIYPRAKLKIVLLPHIIGKYVNKIFRLNGIHRFLCTKHIIPSKRTANTRSLVYIPTYFYSDTYPHSVNFLVLIV